MKIQMTCFRLAVFAVAVSLGSIAQAVVVYTDVAFDPHADDLQAPNQLPFDQIGPGGRGDTTPFGGGTWEIQGAVNQVAQGDDGDGFDFTTTGTFDLTYTHSGGNLFFKLHTGHDNYGGAGAIPANDASPQTFFGLAAGDYSLGFYEQFPTTWSIVLEVEASSIPEPSSIVLGCLGALGLGLVGWRTRGSRR